MQQLDEIVEQYLKMDTSNALMITGKWGAGKTHYFKHNLENKILDTPVFSNAEKTYRPILVSLFGLKSVEEIQSEILLSLYPKSPIVKAVAKGILHLGGISWLGEQIDEHKNSLVNLNKLVLCFDDLERMSENLNIEEFIGYVNSLVENENVKVLIIANEEKILPKKYNVLKEKVVGNTIEFIQNIGDTFDSILKDKFNAFKEYKKFLEINKDYILEIFSKKSENLRTLIFVLSYFQQIYSEIIEKLPIEKYLKERQPEIFLNLLKFTIAISIEYKEGEITFKKRNNLDGNGASEIDKARNAYIDRCLTGNTNTEEKKEKSEKEKFLEVYYENNKYSFYFYNSVYDYITGGATFKYSVLVEELKNIYHIVDNVITEQYEVYDKLDYQSCFSLSDNEYLMLTKQMLNFAYKGYYGIELYVKIFVFATRFNNPLNLDFDKLEKLIIKGMRKGKENYTYSDRIEFNLWISDDTENKEYITRIKKATLDLNSEILSDTETKKSLELEKLCYENFEEFQDKVLYIDKSYSYIPIFVKFNADRFYSFFYNSEPNKRKEIALFFDGRYKECYPPKLKSDIPFLQKLKDRAEKRNKRLAGKNISGFIYSKLVENLQYAINMLAHHTV